jgi:tetratricopeptide (TPR) repeat protein
MSESAPSGPATPRNYFARLRPVLLYTLVGISLSGLTVVTAAASRTWRQERAARSRALYEQGLAQVAAGRPTEALEAFRVALELEHDTTEIQRTLATTLANLGRRNEARAYLTTLLAQDPIDGPANFLMARIADQEAHIAEAHRYYQRAIFGVWGNHDEERTEARVAFAEFLHRTGSRSELLAELLRLNTELTPDDPNRQRVGVLLLEADAPREAAGVFEGITKINPKNASAWAGLSAADVAQGRYLQAREASRRAVALDPDRPDFDAALARTEAIVALVPSVRGLSRREREARARRLFEIAAGSWNRCPGTAEMLTDQTRDMLSALDPQSKHRHVEAPDSSTLLGAAVELWQGRHLPCPSGSPDEQAADVILREDAGQ